MEIEQKHFDAMMNKTKCKFWDDDPEEAVIGFIGALYSFSLSTFGRKGDKDYRNCEPIKTETCVKSFKNISRWFFTHNAVFDERGFITVDGTSVIWEPDMWGTCGKKYKDVKQKWVYDSMWLEEREVKK